VLRAASEEGLAVVPRGAGTVLGWAPAPTACDLVLDLSGMNRVLEHQAGDLIVAAEAGTPLAHLQESVAGAGQRLALDEVVPGTTVGGLLAANLSGPRRMAYGTARDLVIGVTVVRADGVIAKAGGKVVKNVAGYDLGKLMVGSYGTLAVITSAYFRLHPVPQAAAWVTTTCSSPTAATQVVHDAVHSQVVPAAVEIDAAPGALTTVSVLLEGTTVGVAGRVERMLRTCGADATAGEAGPGPGYPGSPDQPLLKLTCQLSSVTQIAQTATELGLHVRGSAGTGVLYATASEGVDLAAALDRLRAETAAAGGATVVLRGAPPGVDAWGQAPGLDLMHAVKDRFDPQHRLSPGRFVGGI
jgi:glycolate oxidase FAD binding subunit